MIKSGDIAADRAAACAWIIRNQFARRNLTPMQRSELALRLAPLIAEKARARMVAGGKKKGSQNSGNPLDTDRVVAAEAGVSHDTIARARQLTEKAAPSLFGVGQYSCVVIDPP